MKTAAQVLVGCVALLHLYFLILEMFLWKTAFGRKTFKTTPEVAESSAVLAANQGLYNGFLAAGLIGVGAWQRVRTQRADVLPHVHRHSRRFRCGDR